MQSRKTSWILMMLGIAVVSFLVGFQPVRHPIKKGPPESIFKYNLPEPVADTERDAKAQEILASLKQSGVDVDKVTFPEKSVLQVETLAYTDEGVKADEAKVTQLLGKQYQGIQEITKSAESQEQPIWQLGTALALYHPRPAIKLGLDLQGGAHVVLQCMPQTRLKFTTPSPGNDENNLPKDGPPMVSTEQAGPGATAETPATAGSSKLPTAQALVARVKAALVRSGVPEDEAIVKMVSPNTLTAETRANDKSTADKQQKIVYEAIQQEVAGALKPTDIVQEAPETVFVDKDTADKVKNIIDRRLYQMSDIREPVIQKQGADRLIVELPGVKDPERVIGIIKSTAMLEFRIVPKRYTPAGASREDYSEWQDSQTQQRVPWDRVMAETKAEFTGRDLESNATVQPGEAGDWVVHFEMRPEKKREFEAFTRRNVGFDMAIVLDDKCQMAPVIRSPLPGAGIIEGKFTTEQARDLKLLLNAGALPVPLQIAEKRSVSATLGQDAISKSLNAGYIGLGLVLLFMVLYYRLPGLLADVALGLYILIIMGVLAMANTTLTLPGIAGIILSIGMAVDANVIIFERLKEELWSGKAMRAAVDAGFRRAWTAILDANVTTLITCAVLYFLGTSVIKSFAVTLFIGVAASLFTAVTVSYWLVRIAADTEYGQKHHLYGVRMAASEDK
jgi:preprotein translocase subunit SecD